MKFNKRFSAFLNQILKSAFLLVCIEHVTFAQVVNQSNQTNKNPIASITQAINNLVAGYGVDQLKGTPTSLLAQSQDIVYNLLVGNVVNAILNPNTSGPIAVNPDYKAGSANMSPTLTGQAVYNLLTVTNTNQTVSNASKIPAPLPSNQPNPQINYLTSSPEEKLNTQNFNMSTLLRPLQYDEKNPKANFEKQNAINFISFASGIVIPPPVLDFKVLNPNQVAQALGDVSVQQYLVSLRAIVAQKSVGLTNLFHLYAERIPVDTEKLAQTNPDIKNTNLFPEASPLKIDQYMATRRFNPEWQNIIQDKAAPAELTRQELYLLREIRYELYLNRLANERILATLSVMELQNTQTQQVFLQQLYNRVISQPPFTPGK